jgi:hypothetical protein
VLIAVRLLESLRALTGTVAYQAGKPEPLSWKRWNRGALGLLVFGLVSGAGISHVAAGLLASTPTIDVVMYAAEESEARLYWTDFYQTFSEEESRALPVETGINNLSFPVDNPTATASFLQRFDPCECGTPTLIERISLSTPLYSKPIPFETWNPAGDTQSFVREGNSTGVNPVIGSIDPQVVFYADIEDFVESARNFAFWIVFAGLGVFALLLVGGITAIRNFMVLRRSAVSNGENGWQPPDSSPTLPMPVVFTSVVVLLFSVSQMFSGALATGVTVDEPAHVGHLTNYLSGGNYSSASYGPVTSLLGHSVNIALGVESWGVLSESAVAYQNRHLAIALLGVLGLVAVGLSAWLMFGSPRWGLVAAAVLGSFPVWVGQSMFNLKDVPAATAYALVTTGLIALFSRKFSSVTRLFISVFTLALGALIGVGTRPGLLPLFVGSIVVAGVIGLVRNSSSRSRGLRLAFATVAGAAIAGYIFVRWTPFGQSILGAVERSIDFPWAGFNIYGGERVYGRPGVSGTAGIFFAYLPTFMTFFLFAGLLFGLGLVIAWAMRRGSHMALETHFVIISAQAFGVFVIVALFDPVIYDGGRQLLFVFPAFALITVMGLYALVRALPYVVSSGRNVHTVIFAVFAIGVTLITVDQVRLFPYNYSYYNEIAQGPGATGRWDTDYWSASLREVALPIAPGDPAICRNVSGDINMDIAVLPDPCDILQPYVGEGAVAEKSELGSREFWAIRTDKGLASVGPIISGNCTFHSAVSRDLRGETIVMSRLYVCNDN